MWITRLHFGRFRETPSLQVLWVVTGLVPAVMFVTGGVMWWNRVLQKRFADDFRIGTVRLPAFAEASTGKKADTTDDLPEAVKTEDSTTEQLLDHRPTGREHFADL